MTEFDDLSRTLHPQTLAVHAGTNRAFQETSEAMVLTSGFAYDSAEQAAARFEGDDPGYIYSRFSNPTVEMLEKRLCAIEGAALARTTASGMAAVTASLMCQLRAGDHMVASRALFGSCRYVADDLANRFGIETTFIDGSDIDAWGAATRANTKVFFLETPSNPGLQVIDIAAVAKARQGDIRLVVDNVFATPILQQPLALGADIVVYSATKHMDGQGRVLGGAILTNDAAYVEDELQPFLRNTGPALSPFNAWVLLKSLETLGLRVRAMAQTADTLARILADEVPRGAVSYPGLPSHPHHEIAMGQMSAGGSLITIDFAGGKETAFAFLNALRLFTISNNLGDAKSLATHPWTTTHKRLSEDQRREQGVTPGLVRLSIGLEHHQDLWDDLRQSLGVAI